LLASFPGPLLPAFASDEATDFRAFFAAPGLSARGSALAQHLRSPLLVGMILTTGMLPGTVLGQPAPVSIITSSAEGASVRKRQRLAVKLLAVWLWLVVGSSAFAARLLSATVQLNGQTALHSTYQDDDFWGAPPGAATVWRYLGKEPLWVEKGTQVQADAADPLRATLRGILVIRLQHVDRLIVEAKTAELTLIRANPSSDKWFLPAGEVERLAQANDIPAVPSLTLFERASTWLGLSIAAVVLVVSISAWLLIRRRREPSSE
jgi:hypothetical protein